MDSLDINTILPPRKRLLAGFKRENSDFELPIPKSRIFDRLRDLMSSGSSSAEEIIEASKLAALAASEAASVAKAAALEKAAAAVKARDVAKNALELLAYISEKEDHGKGRVLRMKSKKKHLPIKLLYKKNKQTARRGETDEELARRLHRAMNSSPRISRNSRKKLGTVGKDGDLAALSERPGRLNKYSIDKLEENVVVCSNADLFQKEELKCGSSVHESKAGFASEKRKAKFKRKKVLLSQCDVKDQKHEMPASVVKASTEDKWPECEDESMTQTDVKHSGEGEVSSKISSMWKCKKLKVSQYSSDGKGLHRLCSDPTASKTSPLVKVD